MGKDAAAVCHDNRLNRYCTARILQNLWTRAFEASSNKALPVNVGEKFHERAVISVVHASKTLLNLHFSCAHVDTTADEVLMASEQGEGQPIFVLLLEAITVSS